jgi:hypothetical protein
MSRCQDLRLGKRQWRYRELMLPTEAQRRPARHQYRQLLAPPNEFADHGGSCQEMLEVVEYEKHLLVLKMLLQGLLQRLACHLLGPKRLGEN